MADLGKEAIPGLEYFQEDPAASRARTGYRDAMDLGEIAFLHSKLC